MTIAAFAMGADEFIVAGVIAEIAAALSVSLGAVGHFESVYALGVAIGAPLFTALGLRVARRAGRSGSLVVFGAVALVGLLALLPRTRRTEAEGGHGDHGHGEAAEHGHGHAAGHDAHGPLSEEDLEGLDAHARMHMGAAGGAHRDLRSQLAALRRPPVWVSLLMTLLGYGGVFTTYTYIAPQLTDVAGFDRVWVTPLLLLFGVGLFIGNMIGGRLADRMPMGSVVGTVAALSATLFAMTALIETQVTAIIGMFVFGLVAWSVVAPLQLQIVTKAGDAPDVSSSANISAVTLGSALGIYLGGLAIDGGLGLTSVNWVGGLLSLSGLGLALLSWLWIDRRYPPLPFEREAAEHAEAVSHH